MNDVLYLCDKKGCWGRSECPGEGYCEHTTDIEHAVNFEKRETGHAGIQYWEKEKEQPKSNDILIVKCNANLTAYGYKQLHAALLDMKESGIVIIPNYCEVISASGVSDIKVEGEEEQNANN